MMKGKATMASRNCSAQLARGQRRVDSAKLASTWSRGTWHRVGRNSVATCAKRRKKKTAEPVEPPVEKVEKRRRAKTNLNGGNLGPYYSSVAEPQDSPVVEAEIERDQLDLGMISHAESLPPVASQRLDPADLSDSSLELARYNYRPIPRVLLVHTGGTLGMDPGESYREDFVGQVHLKEGTGGVYPESDALQPGAVLSDLHSAVPELSNFARLDVEIPFNMDSCRMGPKQWVQLAKLLHKQRQFYDAFLIVHGTDTMAFTASALSLMLAGFRKPIVLTGSQLPLAMPRSDARQNLIDSISCATSGYISNPMQKYPVMLEEVCICFGGKLMRGNRCRKTHSSVYSAFESPMYPNLAELGVEVEWNHSALLHASSDVYQPRFKLNSKVLRVPIVPGCDPRKAYGDLFGRGIHGIVLEVFGVGNMPDQAQQGWLPWLKEQRKKGLQVYLCSQCSAGNLHPELYRSGSVALNMGVESGKQMTPECAVIKMMFCLEYKDIPLSQPIAGEL